jgi:Tat protein translocase TatB subunit
MNFMGIGTGELIVILIIAVLVVGPDKLVELAGKLGRLFVKIRQMTEGATHEFRDALAIDEIQDAIKGVTNEVKDVTAEIKGTADDVAAINTEAQGAVQDIQKATEVTPVATPKKVAPTGPIPQTILEMLGPATNTDTADGAVVTNVTSQTQDQADIEAEPVKVQATMVVADDKDVEPIELDDVVIIEAAGDNHRNMTGSAS